MYNFPPIELLKDYGHQSPDLAEEKAIIIDALRGYDVEVREMGAVVSPNVTVYGVVPARGVRISRIKNLQDDIALCLKADNVRIAVKRGAIAIEVPNRKGAIVPMRSVIPAVQASGYALPIGFGVTTENKTFVADLTKMPHLLMAGATGQGKSVGINAMITSLLYSKTPDEVKFVLIDPKKVEMPMFQKIERQYLARPIVTETMDAVITLRNLCTEMDRRYDILKEAGARNIKEYKGYMPYIVVFIDEFADLIMDAGRSVELPVTKLAQLARAIGIHLVVATQRPSVNVITGLIKANFPARAAFRVVSGMDSRVILDSLGAEQLIGRGDMLLSTGREVVRMQCSFVDTPEIVRLTEYIGQQPAKPFTLKGKTSIVDTLFSPDTNYDACKRLVEDTGSVSEGMIQRVFGLSDAGVEKLIGQLVINGVIEITEKYEYKLKKSQ